MASLMLGPLCLPGRPGFLPTSCCDACMFTHVMQSVPSSRHGWSQTYWLWQRQRAGASEAPPAHGMSPWSPLFPPVSLETHSFPPETSLFPLRNAGNALGNSVYMVGQPGPSSKAPHQGHALTFTDSCLALVSRSPTWREACATGECTPPPRLVFRFPPLLHASPRRRQERHSLRLLPSVQRLPQQQAT